MKNDPLIIYQTEDGKVIIETHFENETVWLNQAQIGGLFQKSKATISEHIKNIFKDGELEEGLVVRDFRTTAFTKRHLNERQRLMLGVEL